MASFLAEKFDYVMRDLSDPRVLNWTGFNSPLLSLLIVAFYLFTIYVLLPTYMKNRKPYSLRTVLFFYNIFQIAACSYLTYGILTSGWTTTYTLGCQPCDYSNNPDAVRMLTYLYYVWCLKGVEMLETVMFVLRKKYNQVSTLHVYHHSSTFLLGWIGVKYVGGGMASFPAIINSIIHIFMYTYYLMASLGPEWQKKVDKWKPTLTMFQMIQFCVIIAHSLQSLHPECKVPKQLLLIYIPNVLLVFRMFWDFYKNNYINKKQKVK